MDTIKISGIPGHDGDYQIDASFFTNRELHKIKQLSGVRAGELQEALNAGDSDVIVAVAVIAMQRNGKAVNEDAIWDAPAGGIAFVGGDAADPPAPAPSKLPAEDSALSGPPSNSSSAPPESDPSPTGSRHSDTGAASVSETSET